MVTHVMSDGTKRDSIDGFVVPAGHPIYRILKAQIRKKENSQNDENNSQCFRAGDENERSVM